MKEIDAILNYRGSYPPVHMIEELIIKLPDIKRSLEALEVAKWFLDERELILKMYYRLKEDSDATEVVQFDEKERAWRELTSGKNPLEIITPKKSVTLHRIPLNRTKHGVMFHNSSWAYSKETFLKAYDGHELIGTWETMQIDIREET